MTKTTSIQIMSIMTLSMIIILGQSTDAFAGVEGTAQIRISDGVVPAVTITDNGLGDGNGDIGKIDFSEPVGCATATGNFAFTKPFIGSDDDPELNLTYLGTSDGACTITIEFTDIDYNAGTYDVTSAIGGQTAGTTSLSTDYDSANMEFIKEVNIASSGPMNPALFNDMSEITVEDTFSVTLTVQMIHGEGQNVSSGGATLSSESVSEPEWEAETSSDPNGVIKFATGTVVDTVNISTTDGVEGDSFTATWALDDKDGNEQTGDCDAAGLLDSNGDATITCTADNSVEYGKIGEQTCWTVTITAPNGYAAVAGQDNPLVGTFADTPLECFIVEAPEWEADTESNPNGMIDAPVDMPADGVSITTTNGVEGDSFTATWALDDKDGNEQTGDCDAAGLLDSNGEATITCTADGPADFGKIGEQTCWTITITAPNGYVADAEQDNPLVGTFADTPLECFIVEAPDWDASTSSDPQDKIFFPVDNPTDTVNINADANFPGTFTGIWTLVDSAGNEQTGDCEDDGAVQGDGTATLTCIADGPTTFGLMGEETCWTIDLTAPEGYDPSTMELDGTGISAECFNMVDQEGLTPGYYKANWDKQCNQNSKDTAPFEDDCSWYLERGDEDFNDAFGLVGDDRISTPGKGKKTIDDPTLRQVLDANNSDAVGALAKHCTAAKLNAEHPDITYFIPNAADVIELCHQALLGNDVQVGDETVSPGELKNILDDHNNNGAEDVDMHWPGGPKD